MFYDDLIPFLILGGLLGLVVVTLTIGVWILKPLDNAAAKRRASVQMMVVDFFGLVFLLQLPMALINLVGGQGRIDPYDSGLSETQLVLYGLASVGSLLVWTRSVIVFSRAGVKSVKDRAITMFLVLPMAYVGTFSVPVLVMIAWFGELSRWSRVVLTVISIVVSVGILLAGRASRRVVARAIIDET